jgi:hypothetical protein
MKGGKKCMSWMNWTSLKLKSSLENTLARLTENTCGRHI